MLKAKRHHLVVFFFAHSSAFLSSVPALASLLQATVQPLSAVDSFSISSSKTVLVFVAALAVILGILTPVTSIAADNSIAIPRCNFRFIILHPPSYKPKHLAKRDCSGSRARSDFLRVKLDDNPHFAFTYTTSTSQSEAARGRGRARISYEPSSTIILTLPSRKLFHICYLLPLISS